MNKVLVLLVSHAAVGASGFVAGIAVPASVDPAAFNTVIFWCESFGQFITAARYR